MDKLSKMAWNARVDGLLALAQAAGYTTIECTKACGKMLAVAEQFADWYVARVMDFLGGNTGKGTYGVGLYPYPEEHVNGVPKPWDCLIVFGVKGKELRCWIGEEVMDEISKRFNDFIKKVGGAENGH